ncbi:hypothetical protein H634G_01848 [Metarhizium anisopliae BRIP 53293]|uniref:Uncharacterized protein n=1 Tax=Metarhizium anisopliae BRIP 53293 TaxID=1291518 RepID=A0A0D9P9F5_METAN|nr:hypothetical protein H634G_01848 [Metarhizium anisopliae BRIP 53293]KJK94194.1 hypothetical protein H633G_01889 [Metarhizium anisopliae BRIP 53284]
MAKLLLEGGANIEAKNNDDRTPLWWAADEGNEDVAKLLLDRGANIEVEDSKFGSTPLLQAAQRGYEAVKSRAYPDGVRLYAKFGFETVDRVETPQGTITTPRACFGHLDKHGMESSG